MDSFLEFIEDTASLSKGVGRGGSGGGAGSVVRPNLFWEKFVSFYQNG